MDKKFSIQWHDPEGIGFWLRGITPDGSFYGELMCAYSDPKRTAGTTVDGQLPPAVWAQCQRLINGLCHVRHVPDTQWTGQLACWTETISAPQILFRYCIGDEVKSAEAKQFLVLKRLLDDQLEAQTRQLMEFSTKTHKKPSDRTW